MRTEHPLIEDYLRRLARELSDLPKSQRAEIVQEIREHIEEAHAERPTVTEADVKNLLDRVGDPAEIAMDARERFGIRPKRPGAVEVAALILLPIGGILIPVIGWFIGVVLLWVSSVWTQRDKLIGTFLLPGGLALPFWLALIPGQSSSCSSSQLFTGSGRPLGPVHSHCVGQPSHLYVVVVSVLMIIWLLVPIATTIYLAVQLRRARDQR